MDFLAERENSQRAMVSISEILKMGNNMDMESINGQTEAHLEEIFIVARVKDLGNILTVKIQAYRKGHGKKVS